MKGPFFKWTQLDKIIITWAHCWLLSKEKVEALERLSVLLFNGFVQTILIDIHMESVLDVS